MTIYFPTRLKPWMMPANYAGGVWPAYYSAGVGQSRDSDVLERANFAAMVRALGGESDTVTIVREGHWAVGWVEWVAIHQDDETALQTADRIIGRLEDYPVIDDDLHSQMEDDECAEVWSACYSPAERVEYLRTHSYTAASWADVRHAVAGEWGAAANMLHCPSDLIH